MNTYTYTCLDGHSFITPVPTATCIAYSNGHACGSTVKKRSTTFAVNLRSLVPAR